VVVRLRRRLLVLLGLFSAFYACSDSPDEFLQATGGQGGSHAGTTASTGGKAGALAGGQAGASSSNQGAHDAGLDAASGSSAGTSADSGTPSPIDSLWPGWTYVGNKDVCRVYLPNDASVVPPISWEPCAISPGCQQLTIDWETDDTEIITPGSKGQSFEGKRLLSLQRRSVANLQGTTKEKLIASIHDLNQEGAPLVGWGSSCAFAAVMGLWRDQAAFMFYEDGINNYRFFAGPISEIRLMKEPNIKLSFEQAGVMGELDLGDRFLIWTRHVLDMKDMKPVFVPPPKRLLAEPRVWGKDAFFQEQTKAPFTEVVRREDGSLFTLLSAPNAWITSFFTDGDTMVWYQASQPQADGAQFDHWELWSAPYTNDPSKLTAQKLLTLPSMSGFPLYGVPLRVTPNHILTADPTGAYVYRRTSGEWRKVPQLQKPLYFSETVHFDDEEIILLQKKYATGKTLVRLPLAGLPLQAPELSP
jgi:hypothetical protein